MQDILIVASAHLAAALADTLRLDLDLALHLVPDRLAALELLRRQEFALIVLDEGAGGAGGVETKATDLVYKHAGAATLLELNFVLASVPRLQRQIRAALLRRAQDRAAALSTVTASLQSELGASLTSILLQSELALRQAPPALAPRLRHLVDLAGSLQSRLRP